MRAVIVEIKENNAVALLADGTFQSVPNDAYEIGTEINTDIIQTKSAGIRKKASLAGRWKQKAVRAAAIAATVTTLGGGSTWYAAQTVFAYSTVTVETDDAEVELTLNRRNEVIKAEALNEGGKPIVDEIHVSRSRRKPLENTLQCIQGGDKETGADIEIKAPDNIRKKELNKQIREILPERIPDTSENTISQSGTKETVQSEQQPINQPAPDTDNAQNIIPAQDVPQPNTDNQEQGFSFLPAKENPDMIQDESVGTEDTQETGEFREDAEVQCGNIRQYGQQSEEKYDNANRFPENTGQEQNVQGFSPAASDVQHNGIEEMPQQQELPNIPEDMRMPEYQPSIQTDRKASPNGGAFDCNARINPIRCHASDHVHIA